MFQPITKIIVFYENGQTDEFVGPGKVEVIETTKVVEKLVDGKLKPESVRVRYVTSVVNLLN